MPIPAHDLQAELIVMNSMDNVATALRDLNRGDVARYTRGDREVAVQVLSDIPFGHKIAIFPITTREKVIKYGEVIGTASTSILVGEHVHVQNVEGVRGRGDIAIERGRGL